MSRPNLFTLAGIFLVFIAVFGGLPLLKGGLYFDSHEGDAYHLVDIVFRIVDGQAPHQDFVTPLGLFAFLPLVEALKAGLSFGKAFTVSQIFVALLLWPVVTYAAWSRLSKAQAIVFACIVLGLVLTMTYLQASSGVTVAMHYNRWAWAMAFVALLLAICPPSQGVKPRGVLDGSLIGLLAAGLFMTKMTFFVALAPAVVAALIVRKQGRALVAALVAGTLVLAVCTLFLGAGFWAAYYSDLLTVARSDVRPNPGLPFSELLASPRYIAVTFVGIATALLIRRAGHDLMALVVIALLLPGVYFVMYQNFGNDPTWLLLFSILVLVFRPEVGFAQVLGLDVRGAMNAVSFAAVLVNFPSFFNTAMAPIEHQAFPPARFMPFFEGDAHQDFFVRRDRANSTTASVALDESSPIWAKYNADAERGEIRQVGDVAFPYCELGAGSRAYMVEIANQLAADGIPAGSQFFSTGLLSAFWLYGDFQPLENGAPWYYGDLSGIENADYVLIPKCVYVDRVRSIMIDDLLEADIELTLLHNNALYALYDLE